MHVMRIMDGTGDTKVEWKPGEMSEAEVKVHFDRLIANGYLGYAKEDSGNARHLRVFEPDAREIVMTPPLVGG